jgi:hypothetical protein
MAMWPRRRIQRYLEENSHFVSQSTLHDWVQRLNTISDDYVATEWEVALLNGFARVGTVQHEPALGKKRIDLVFTSSSGKLAFGADIATISDQQLHRENPVEAFSEELGRRTRKANIRTGGFSFHIQEKRQPTNLGSGNQRSLLLPATSGFGTHIFNASWQDFIRLVKSQPNTGREYTARSKSPVVLVSIVYHPGRLGVFQGQHGSYTGATVVDDNPLFNALKVKARQLKKSGYAGPNGIIICDGGCRMLTSWPDWSTYSMAQVVAEFFRQHGSVEFVSIIAIKQGSQWGRNEYVYDPKCFLPKRSRISEGDLGVLLVEVVHRLPPIQLTPENAVRVMKWKKSGKYGGLGGWSVGGNKIKISARDLLALMAGQLDQERFVKGYSTGASNFFDLRLKRGELITSATVERRPDEDDDWVTFEFSEPDPAVARFSEPTSKVKC